MMICMYHERFHNVYIILIDNETSPYEIVILFILTYILFPKKNEKLITKSNVAET